MSHTDAKKSRTRSFVHAISMGYANQLVTLITGLFLTPYFIRSVGSDGYGAWLVTCQGIALVGILDFGTSFLCMRKISMLSGQRWYRATSIQFGKVTGEFTTLALLQTGLMIGAFLILSPYIPDQLKLRTGPMISVLLIYSASLLLKPCTQILTGLQEVPAILRFQLVSWLVNTVSCVVLVQHHYGTISLALSWALAELTVPLLCAVRLRTHHRERFKHYRFRPLQLPLNRYLVRGRWQFLGQISQLLNYSTDVTLIGRISGEQAAASYALTSKLYSVAQHLPSQVVQVATPAVFQLVSEHSPSAPRSNFFRVFTSITLVTLLSSGVLVCVITIINRDFVSWWVGAANYGGYRLTVAIALNMTLRHFLNCFNYGCLWAGKERESVVCTTLGGLLNVGLAVPFTNWWGAEGTVWANTMGIVCISIPWAVWWFKESLKRDVLSVLKPFGTWAFRTLLVLIAGYGFSKVPASYGPFGVAAKGFFGTLLYILFLRPVISSPQLAQYLSPRFRQLRLWRLLVIETRHLAEQVEPEEAKKSA